MRFPSAFLDDVRDRVPLSAIVGLSVVWDKRKTNPGKRDFWGCCPFHGEKTPSFHVDDRKGRYHCFGCGKDGDHFRFLMEHGGRTFPEAVEEVAKAAGLELPEVTPQQREQAAKRMTLVEANERAARWYQQQLVANMAKVGPYLERRGITPAEVDRFRLGYAPEGNRLHQAALGREDNLLEAGLLARHEDGRVYDRFRNRLMFPLLDAKGQAFAFSGRAMGEDAAKYLNSPETPIFSKGTVMYNGAAARQEAWDGSTYVVVEGNVDVIASERAGMATAAPLGTALTEGHVKLMAKAADTAVLAFDGDDAGRKAAARAIDLILPAVSPAFTVRFAELPDGMDPDALVTRSTTRYIEAIAGATPMVDMLWRRESAAVNPEIPEQRAKLEAGLRVALKRIVDPGTRRAYGQNIKARLDALGERPKVYRSNSFSHHSTSPATGRLLRGFQQATGLTLREAILVGAIAAAPQAALDVAEGLGSDTRLSPEAAQLVNRLVGALMGAGGAALEEVLEAAGLTEAVEEALAKANAAGVAMELGNEGDAARGVLAAAVRH